MNRKITTLMMSLGLLTIFSSSINAQNIRANQETQPFQNNETNSLYRDGFNPFDFIHNANFSSGRSGADFAEDTQNNIRTAAEEFRRLQQQRIQEMKDKPTDSSPVE